MKEKTWFGYQEVDKREKPRLVNEVFDSVADRYDLMNDLMSGGVHRLWKRYLSLLCAPRAGQHVLDLAGGTCDIALLLYPALRQRGEIVIADINAAMLEQGYRRMVDLGMVRGVSFVQCDAETLCFNDNSFDTIVMSFGLRNVTDPMRALHAVRRVLKVGGHFLILEFSQVNSWLQPLYDAWSFKVLPRLGRWIANDEASYRYLAESIRRHPDQATLLAMMREAGFEKCQYFNLSQGIVAIHSGYKLSA